MKKRLILIPILAIFLLASFSSCKSTTSFESSSEEYDYALHYALEASNENVITDLYFKITQAEAFLPTELSFITEKSTDIPGMTRLIAQWSTYMNNYTMQWFESLHSYLQELVSNMVFENPIETVNSSNDSASTAFEQAFSTEIKVYLKQNLEEVDLTYWQDIVTQYRAWVATNRVLLGTEEPELGEVDIKEMLAQYMCDIYFSNLKSAEVLFRTTPDPNADKTVSKIFGLD